MALINRGCGPDFYGGDFHSEDFNTVGGFPFSFRTFIVTLLPTYFLKHDTYKDKDDKGLLERYLTIFGEEIDTEMAYKLECYLQIIDAQICQGKFITHLSESLGSPPDIFRDDRIYRNLLTYIVSIYKIKGTLGAYQLFFSILGYGVNLIELPPTTIEANYDSGGIYDGELGNELYDQDPCVTCTEYDIEFYPLEGSPILSNEVINKLRSVVYFNEPINAKLRNFISSFLLEDTWVIDIEDETNHTMANVPHYDSTADNKYDEVIEYDDDFNVIVGGRNITVGIGVSGSEYDSEISIQFTNLEVGETIDIENTYFQAHYYNEFNQLVYSRGDKLDIVEPITQQGIIKVKSPIPQKGYSYIKVIGRIVVNKESNGYPKYGEVIKTVGPWVETSANVQLN